MGEVGGACLGRGTERASAGVSLTPPLPAISHASTLAPLAAYPRLACLRLAGTPLAAAPEAAAHLAELLPHVDVALA